ncbi:uncharacterized protein LOC126655979 [Mercurialis annua]|uniref:uncharacterized protein LOC126655979 n=1 Tax=Mercurialis annua TaxID=3986 RepID=UPI00215E1168|nr:uncharacterized protein LOC126655979 [Mercurialis annua]
MTCLGRVLRTARPSARVSKNLSFSHDRSLLLLRHLPHQTEGLPATTAIAGSDHGPYRFSSTIFPAAVAGLFGMLQVAYAEEADSHSPTLYKHLLDIAKQERNRIEDSFKLEGLKSGAYPEFIVAVKDQKVIIKIQIPPACDVSHLIADLVVNLGSQVYHGSGGSGMLLRACGRVLAWQLTLGYPEKLEETDLDEVESAEGDLCIQILLFYSRFATDKAEIRFMKGGSLSATELNALVSVLKLAGRQLRAPGRNPGENC